MYECYEEESCKSKLLTILVNLPLTLEKQNEIQAYKNVDTLSSKNKWQFYNLMTGDKTSGKG